MKSITRGFIAIYISLSFLTSCFYQTNAPASEPTLIGADAIVNSTLSVHLPKRFYSLHEPITATVQLEVTHGWILVVYSTPLLDYDIRILNSAGTAIGYTEMGGNGFPEFSSHIAGRLDPVTSPLTQQINLNLWFDISTTGSYTLELSTSNIRDSSSLAAKLITQTEQLTSVPITFTVISTQK